MKTKSFLHSSVLCLVLTAPFLRAAGPAEPAGGRVESGKGTYEVQSDLEFARLGGVSLKLDAHIPPGKGPFPTVILVHGGGWTGGHKTIGFVQPLFEPLTQGGFTWFTIDYRLAPDHPYPAPVEDVEAAVEYVTRNAKRFKVDKKRIALMGESAGAHLVNLVGIRNRQNSPIDAVVSIYGPFDLVLYSRKFAAEIPKSITGFLGITEMNAEALATLHEASPLTYADKHTPKFLLIHGTKDEAVPYEQSTFFQACMKRLGRQCDLIIVEDGPHGVIRWEKDPRFQAYKTEMVEWLHKNLGSKK